MADLKRPVEEVSAAEAEQLFASAARALGGTGGRSAGFRRVSIPVPEPIRPEPERAEESTIVLDPVPAVSEEADRFGFGSTTVIPSAVVFDRYEDEGYGEEEEFEPTNADIEEEVAFSALEEALRRHADVYGDPRQNRRDRYHDYGFGMGITFDGPAGYEDDEDYE